MAVTTLEYHLRTAIMRALCWYLHHNDYNGFRLEELEALATLQGVEVDSLWEGCERPDSHSEDQFVFVNVPSEQFCIEAMQRSLLVRAFIEVSLTTAAASPAAF